MMPSALRLVRSGVLILLLGFAPPPALADGSPGAAIVQPPADQARRLQHWKDGEQSQAAVMDLWLATSLALLLHHYRRRRRTKG